MEQYLQYDVILFVNTKQNYTPTYIFISMCLEKSERF